jgi:large subunit ribosomal protein L18
MSSQLVGRARRKLRIRKKINGTTERPRLSVFRSAKHIYAQVIDDTTGKTIAHASTLSKELKGKSDAEADKSAEAKKVGALIAQLCKAKNVTQVVFDRNGYLYHGRIVALADGAREAGLSF